MSILGQFQFRRDLAANWSTVNPILLSGEMGIESDTDLFKLGDGTTSWNMLPYGGIQGTTGVASQTIVGTTTVVNPNVNPSVTDADPGANADLRFNLPRAREVIAQTTNTVLPTDSASVTQTADAEGDVLLTFNIPRGAKGWSPILANQTDGERRVLRLVDWTGGEGTKPTVPTDNYIGATGFTDLAGATDIRGATGLTGPAANAFTIIAVAGQNTVAAEQANDTLNLVGAGTVSITTNDLTDTIVITGTATPPQNTFSVVTGNTGTATADVPSDTLAITGGTGITTVATDTPDGLVITNTDTGSSAVSTHVSQLNPHTQYSRLTSYYFYAPDYGTLTDGSDTATVAAGQASTNTATIQAAIQAAKNNGGGIVLLPQGTYHISNTLTIDSSNVVMMGLGAYGNTDASGIPQTGFGTSLFWNNTASPATTAMIDVISPAGPTNPAVKSSGVQGVTLQCAGNVGIGLRVRSIHWGLFKDIYIINPTAEGLATECLVTGTTLGEAADVTKCQFENVRVRLLEAPANATGFSLDGAANANTSNSTFRNLAVSCQGAQLAMDIKNTDSNRFYDIAVNQSNGGTVQPIRLRGGATAGVESRGNAFYYLATGGSSTGLRGLYSEGTETAGVTAPAKNNVVYGYSIENGEPYPIIGTGSTLTVYPVGGVFAPETPTAVATTVTGTTETIVARWNLPVNYFQPNKAYEISILAQITAQTTAGATTVRVRCGSAGTTADAIVATSTASATGALNAWIQTRIIVHVLTATTITASIQSQQVSAVVGNATAAFAAATINSATALNLSVSHQQGGVFTTTIRAAKLIPLF